MPHVIGETIGGGSPVIVGLRVDKDGMFQSSVYYNYVDAGYSSFKRRVLEPLVPLLGWPSDLSKSINEDISPALTYKLPRCDRLRFCLG